MVIHDAAIVADPNAGGSQGDVHDAIRDPQRWRPLIEYEGSMGRVDNRSPRVFVGVRVGIMSHGCSSRLWDGTQQIFLSPSYSVEWCLGGERTASTGSLHPKNKYGLLHWACAPIAGVAPDSRGGAVRSERRRHGRSTPQRNSGGRWDFTIFPT